MNFLKNVSFMLNRNNKDYIKKEIAKTNDIKYIEELITKSSDITDEEILSLAINKGLVIGSKSNYSNNIIIMYIKIMINRQDKNLDYFEFLNFYDLTQKEFAELDKIIYRLIDEGLIIKYDTPYVFRQFRYIKYAVEHGQSNALNILYIGNLTEEEKKELDSLIYKAIDNGYQIDYSSNSVFCQFKYIKYAMEHGQISAIERINKGITEEEKEELDKIIYKEIDKGNHLNSLYLSDTDILKYIKYAIKTNHLDILNDFSSDKISKVDQELDELVYRKIDDGMHIDHNVPYMFWQFKYIKYAVEHGQSDAIFLINFLNEVDEKELDELIYKLIDEGVKIDLSFTGNFHKFKYIKYAVEHGHIDVLNQMQSFEITEEEDHELDILVYNILDNGFQIDYLSPDIFRKFKYIKYAIKHGQKDALNALIFNEIVPEQELDNLVYKAIDDGYQMSYNTPNKIRCIKYIKYAVEQGQISALNYLNFNELTEEEENSLDEIIFKLIDGFYIIEYGSAEIFKEFKYIKYAVEHGQKDAIKYLKCINKKHLNDEELALCKLALDKGYVIDSVSPDFIFNEEIIIYALVKNRISFRNPIEFNFDIMNDKFKFSKDNYKFLFEDYIKNFVFENINVYLMLLTKYKNSVEKDNSLNEYCSYLLEKVKQELQKKFKEEYLINTYLSQVLDGNRNPINFTYIQSDKDLAYVIKYTDLKIFRASENNAGITFEILNKGNQKQIKMIIELLRNINVREDNIPLLAINIYISLEYPRAIDLLNGKYGKVDEYKLLTIFKNIVPSSVLFTSDGNRYKPQINEQLINLAFGSNYNILNTPIRNYLNGFDDKVKEIENKKAKANIDLSMTFEKKEERIRQLDYQLEQYKANLFEFFKRFGEAFNQWDIIEEEFLKSQAKTMLTLKLNISKVGELCKSIEAKRKMPDLEPRDDMLRQSDVFDYAFFDTQFTNGHVETIPSRIVELSRRMDDVKTKKFPNIEVKYGKYTMKVYGPQDRRILSAGYRSHCCFRACGFADNSGADYSLLNYCVSTEYGGGVEIFDENGKTIMFSPVLRNGNVLMIHSVETELQSNLPKECYELLVEFSNEIIKKSEEVGDDISFVTITDLHYLDKSFTEGELPDDKKYHIYDEDKKFNGIYHNLKETSHMILAHKDGKKVDDIVYGSIEKDYEFDLPKIFGSLSVSEEEKKIIGELDVINKEYIDKANKRYQAQQGGNETESYKLLAEIKEIKKQYLIKYRELVSIRKSTDIYSDYEKGISFVENINEKLGETIDLGSIYKLTYSTDWYIIRTSDNQVIANALPSGIEELKERLNKLKEAININENDIENSNNKKM